LILQTQASVYGEREILDPSVSRAYGAPHHPFKARLFLDASVLVRRVPLVEYFKLPSIQHIQESNLLCFFIAQIASASLKFGKLNENKSDPLTHHSHPTQDMSPANLTESIEQKVRAASGRNTSTLNGPSSDRFVTRQYRFISRNDYRDFFNSLSPGEARYFESPIPPDIQHEEDGSVIVGFRLPS
jgi:hypothetical protein